MKRDHAWLESYTEMLKGKAVLELGCGPGIDSKVLSQFSDFLVSCDLAPKHGIQGSVLTLDHSKKLPFKSDSFDTVVASLCLHYFSFERTKEIIAEISRLLRPHGSFICRLNSYKDINYGATGHAEIEPGLFNVNGQQKRFFQEKEIEALWASDYSLHELSLKRIDRYQKAKYVYEFSATVR